MYIVAVTVEGVAPLLQNRFPLVNLEELKAEGHGKKQTGAVDYSEEWKEKLYLDKEGYIYQPASHFEGVLKKVSTNFKIPGKRGKSYKDLFVGTLFVTPEYIRHNYPSVEDLATLTLTDDPTQPLYLDIRSVVIKNRGRVNRIRPAFAAGWQLSFFIEAHDEQVPLAILQEALELGGRTVGIGDYRPKFGRFRIVSFEKQNDEKNLTTYI